MERSDFLKSVPLFSDLNREELRQIESISGEKRYRKNEIIFHAEDLGAYLFILKEGSVKISLQGREGREVILRILYPKEFFGDMALLDGYHRSATVTAFEDSKAVLINREDFLNLIGKHPEVALKIMSILSKRLRKADERIASLVFLDAHGKVARSLLDLIQEQGKKTEEGIVIDLKLRREELSDLAGLTRETTTRVLKDFETAGAIRRERKRLIILREDIIKREAEKSL
ncbi:MAG: Crp/Fnr family transcriptional regulator [Nitrospirae bacterium]|nr:Crp/Fnr family transcriptional regulator [Nitrospirota bacterium]